MSEKPLNQSTPSKGSPATATGSSKTAAPNTSEIVSVVKSLQFAWFVGHVVTLVSIFFYALTYIKIGTRFYKFWYQLALLGVLESFGILVYQLVSKRGAQLPPILKDDNTHYFLLGAWLLLLRPYVLLTLSSFALFSVFHVLAYVKGYLLPAFHQQRHPVSQKIGEFISTNNTKSIQLASLFEIYTLAWLVIRLVTIRKRSLTPVLLYVIFIKLRFEKSIYTRGFFKSIEIHVEELVNKANVPALKQAWIHLKQFNRRIGGIYLVNDYTKEKST